MVDEDSLKQQLTKPKQLVDRVTKAVDEADILAGVQEVESEERGVDKRWVMNEQLMEEEKSQQRKSFNGKRSGPHGGTFFEELFSLDPTPNLMKKGSLFEMHGKFSALLRKKSITKKIHAI